MATHLSIILFRLWKRKPAGSDNAGNSPAYKRGRTPHTVQSVIGTKACPGLRSGMRLNGFRVRQRPPIRHSREGGNPRTNIPRKIANRDTTTYVNTATPLRLSGKSASRFPIRGGNLREAEGWHK